MREGKVIRDHPLVVTYRPGRETAVCVCVCVWDPCDKLLESKHTWVLIVWLKIQLATSDSITARGVSV